MRKGLILVSVLGWIAAGCGGSSKGGSAGGTGGGTAGGTGGGGGAGGGGTSNASPDLATPAAPADMTQLGCMDLVNCLNAAVENNDQAAEAACEAEASPMAKSLFQTLGNCVNSKCGTTLDDAGTGSCSSSDQCNACVLTGSGPNDMGMNGSFCVNDFSSNTPVTDPLCGVCVPQFSACLAN